MDTLGSLHSMGNDLARTEQVTKELSMRKFATLVILYLIALCLSIVILHVLYWKLTAKLHYFY